MPESTHTGNIRDNSKVYFGPVLQNTMGYYNNQKQEIMARSKVDI